MSKQSWLGRLFGRKPETPEDVVADAAPAEEEVPVDASTVNEEAEPAQEVPARGEAPQEDAAKDEKETGMSAEGYHEPLEELSDETRDMHRAISSLMEELEAVDWYNQRMDACKDPELKAILKHNRDEEKEHAAMVLEWIRRRDPVMDKELKDYLFTDKPIAHE